MSYDYSQYVKTICVAIALYAVPALFFGKRGTKSRGHDDIPPAFGVLELKPGENPVVDIVAIHGLDGHRETSWTSDENGVLWLRDLLPSKTPNARILTFGYDANTRNKKQLTRQSLFTHGKNLASRLSNFRISTETRERPIIFVAHSLGGIVLKSALIHCHAADRNNLAALKAIDTSTYGILFMGTPHQGSDFATFGRLLSNVLSVYQTTNTTLVESIERDSETLLQQLAQYANISGYFETRFFFEAYPTLIGGTEIMIVPEASAVVLGQTNVESLPIHRNHAEMVKFASADDGDFKEVSMILSYMTRAAPDMIAARWDTYRKHEAIEINPPSFHQKKKEINPPSLSQKQLCPLPVTLPYNKNDKSFIGRETILQLIHDKFVGESIVCLYGIGGLGKTKTAVEYVYAHRLEYDIIFWVFADTIETTNRDFVGIAQQLVNWKVQNSRNYSQAAHDLGLNGVVNAKTGQINVETGQVDAETSQVTGDILPKVVKAVIAWLSKEDSGRWLLIFDNVDHLERVNLHDFFPTMVVGRILITSRTHEITSFGKGLRVPPLSASDSLQLLLRKAEKDEPDEAARQIVTKLGGLPLAIETAGAYISAYQYSFEKYLKLHEERWNNIFSKPMHSRPYSKSLSTTWGISYEAIESQNPIATNILNACAFLGNENIPIELFSKQDVDETRTEDALELLFRFSLANRTSDEKFSIHPLVHTWARERLSSERQTEMAAEAVRLIGETLNPLNQCSHCEETPSSHEEEIPFIFGEETPFICAQYALDYKVPEIEGLAETKYQQTLASVLKLGVHHHHFFQFKKLDTGYSIHVSGLAMELTRRGLAALKKSLGVDHPIFVQMKQDLVEVCVKHQKKGDWQFSETLQLLGEPDGRGVELCRHILKRQEELLGPDHKDTISTMISLAASLYNLHQWDEAEALSRRSLKVAENVLGPDKEPTLQAIDILGLTLFRHYQFDEAEKLFRRSLDARTNELGPDHHNTICSMEYLGRVLSLQRRFDEADGFLRRGLDLAERTLSPNATLALEIVDTMGATLSQRYRFDEAEKLFRRVLEGRTKVPGPEHRDTIVSMERLGSVLSQQHRFDEADGLLRRGLDLAERTLGPNAILTFEIVDSIGVTLSRRYRFDEAEKPFRRALEGRTKDHGPEHRDTIYSMKRLGRVLSKQHRFDEAEKLLRHGLDLAERISGADDLLTIEVAECLGSTLSRSHQLDEAETLFRRAHETRRKIQTSDHPDTLDSGNRLGIVLTTQRRFKEAERLLRSCLELIDASPNYGRESALAVADSLGVALLEAHRCEEAGRVLRSVLGRVETFVTVDQPQRTSSTTGLDVALIQPRLAEGEALLRRSLGERDKMGLNSRIHVGAHNLGVALLQQHQLKEAEELLRQAVDYRKTIFGQHGPETLLALVNLSVALFQQGRFEDAEPLARCAVERQQSIMGLRHPETLSGFDCLAAILIQLHRLEEAEQLIRDALKVEERKVFLEHRDAITSVMSLCLAYLRERNFERATSVIRVGLGEDESLGLQDTLSKVLYSVLVLVREQKYDVAEEIVQSVVEGLCLRAIYTEW